jgi:hypothetical protein
LGTNEKIHREKETPSKRGILGPSTYSSVSCFPIFSFHVTPFKKYMKPIYKRIKVENS